MADLAQAQIQRLVHLVAWMSQRDTDRPIRYREAARQLGRAEALLRADLQVLLDLTETHNSSLGSLSIALVAGGFYLGSRGPFQRPLRLSRDEALVLLLGLVGVRGGRELAARLGSQFHAAPDPGEVERTWAMGPTPGEQVSRVLALCRRARDGRRKLALSYCGSASEPSRRVVHPRQIVQAGGAWYLIAWCEKSRATRHFRVERILEATELEESFVPRRELQPVKATRDLLSADAVATATVAFSPRIARWIRERYPSGDESPDGRYLVRLPVADPRWLAREVLQYGAEAEVLAPEGMRELVRRLVE